MTTGLAGSGSTVTTPPPRRFRFRPGPLATATALLGFVVLVGLGAWQLQRMDWKAELIALREARLAAPPVALPDDPADGAMAQDEIAALEFRRVTVSGVFLHDREMFFFATRQGSAGFHVITPLRRTGGGVVLIDRGWVPAGARPTWLRADGQLDGTVTVEGLIRSSPRRGRFTPDNDPAKNTWFWFDFAAMAAHAGVTAPAFVVEAGPAANPGGLPIGRELRVTLRNPHLTYAIIWYCLALALAVIFGLSRRAPVEPDGSGGSGEAGGAAG